MFSEPLKVKVNLEEGKVILSIRTSDVKVEVYEFDIAVFSQMVAHFIAAKEESDE